VPICKKPSPARGNKPLLYKRHAAGRGSGTHADTTRGRRRKTIKPTYHRELRFQPGPGGTRKRVEIEGSGGRSCGPPALLNGLPARFWAWRRFDPNPPPGNRVLENAHSCRLEPEAAI
jgi:hypothetical protein